MTASAPADITVQTFRFLGWMLVCTGVFVGGVAASSLVWDWYWYGSVITQCVITGKGESPIITCEIRSEGRPPTQLSIRDTALWRWPSAVGESIRIQYLPRDPTRVRRDVSIRTMGSQQSSHDLRHLGAWGFVISGAFLIVGGAVPVFYGMRFLRRSRAVAGDPAASQHV